MSIAARDVLSRRSEQRLHLRQHGTRALHHAGHAGAGRVGGTTGKQQLGGVRHLCQPLVQHFEDADLIRRAEAVLRRAQDSVGHVLVALEIEYAVHHMLQDLRAGDRAFLIDVPDHEYRDALPLGELHQRHRAILHLSHTACR